ncbi:SUMF1/EgtB/PvdO family nonheme iron enzyme [Thiothrix eikelboomii]|uniref:SUMF1/EgtB/PvdO family nonheme iron enzyme n=1 Tax=Thiothrix eikelboomii TaxID=92487 RepID=UPI003BAE8053
MQPSQQVFISYARDRGVSEQLAAELHAQLTQAGIVAFRDVEGLEPGVHWADVLEKQILASRLLIVLISQAALDPQRWVMRECLFASNKRIPIIPVLVEPVDLPLWLTHINAIDFIQSKPWSRLLLGVGKYVEVEVKPQVIMSERRAAAPAPPKPAPAKPNPQARPAANFQAPYSAEVQGLLAELQNPQTLPPRRLAIGDRLNALGDPRPGVGLHLQTGLPAIDWVQIPAGSFIYQNGERPHLKSFYISRYPITNAQFQAFEQAKEGYWHDAWWEGLERADQLPRHRWIAANRPVERVSWYDAIAFCRWLSAKTGQSISLPTEQQWEKAARGVDGRNYPWGETYEIGYANCNEKYNQGFFTKLFAEKRYYLEQTCAVGLYPQGQTASGVMDLAGNMWEWCSSKYKQSMKLEPYVPNDWRVIRGGSWDISTEGLRCSVRNPSYPATRDLVGFRVCAFSLAAGF